MGIGVSVNVGIVFVGRQIGGARLPNDLERITKENRSTGVLLCATPNRMPSRALDLPLVKRFVLVVVLMVAPKLFIDLAPKPGLSFGA